MVIAMNLINAHSMSERLYNNNVGEIIMHKIDSVRWIKIKNVPLNKSVDRWGKHERFNVLDWIINVLWWFWMISFKNHHICFHLQPSDFKRVSLEQNVLWQNVLRSEIWWAQRFFFSFLFFSFPNTCWLKRELPRPNSFWEDASHFMLQESVGEEENKTKKKRIQQHIFLLLIRDRRSYIPFTSEARLCGELTDRRDFQKVSVIHQNKTLFP